MKQTKGTAETPEKKDTPPTKPSSPSTKKRTSRIINVTKEVLGKSIIITGAPKPTKK